MTCPLQRAGMDGLVREEDNDVVFFVYTTSELLSFKSLDVRHLSISVTLFYSAKPSSEVWRVWKVADCPMLSRWINGIIALTSAYSRQQIANRLFPGVGVLLTTVR